MKILVIFGTRPEAIKLAPLIHRLKTSFDVKVLSSGQHIELIGQVIDFFKIKPDYNFACMKDKPDLESLYECTLSTMKTVIHQENPDAIIVQGDTITTFSGAFLGFMLKKPVLHVEAGLRTFKSFSPFPEEMLRMLASRIATFHFAPTSQALENLVAEGIKRDRILVTGNTVVKATC
ncbi:MAG: UDP-N-acetylglucosamine 2-epimerase [Nitrospirae bacterium]|nr:UDP-N-acetylglucosamine 2-epimerase [Nitrospirota bacterium]